MTETLRAVSVDKSEDLESRAEDVAQYQQREDLADVNGGGS